MTIENLGVKLYSGLKQDRKSASLGSSADGTNTGITLVTATSTAEQTTGAEENTLNASDTRGMGEYVVNTSSTLYGKTLTDVQFNIKKATGGDTPAVGEVVRARHYNSSNTLIHTYWTKDATTLPTSFAWTSETTLSGDTAYAVGDYFVCEFTETDGTSPTGFVKINRKANGSGTKWDSTNSGFINTYFSASNWTDTNRDIQFKITLSDSSAVKLGTGAYSFDGTDDYVVLTDVGTNGIDTTGDLSIVGWINLNATNANQAIISNDSNSSSAGINLYVHSSNQLRFGGGSAGTQVTGATGKFTAGTWYHVAVVKSGANCSLYVDGVQDGSTQTDWGTIDGQAQATIGAQYSGSAYGDDFNGKIDDLAIYKRALTTTEIGKLANNNASANKGFYAANANQSCADGKFTFDLQRKVGTDTSSWDLYDDVPTSANETSWTSANTVSDETWTLRGKIRFTSIGANENWCWIALTRNYYGFTSNDAISSSYGIGAQFRFGTSLNTYYTNDLVANGTSFAGQKGTGDNSQNWTPAENTDYYLEIKRTSTTSYSVSMFENADFSTDPIGTITGTCSNTITKLKYIKVMNTYVNPAGTGSDIEGYVSWWKFYDGTNSPSGTPTKTYEFVDGDAQLVSSLTNKSELKAYYSMDSTSLGATADVTDDLTTDKGWVSNTSDWSYNATNDTIDLATVRRSTTAQRIYIDLQDADYLGSGNNLSDTSWVIRLGKFKVNALAPSLGVTAIVCLSDSIGDSGTNQDAVGFDYGLKSTELYIRLKALNGVHFEGGGQVSDQFSSSIVPSTSTSYRWELTRDGNVFTMTAFAENDTTYSTPLETATVTKTGITGLRYFKIINDSEQNNSQTGDMEIFGDIKIYDGVSSLDGCKNDFSSTSALDGVTGIRTNSIFQQTDDTPSYWWFNGTSWVLDGTTQTGGDDITTDITWTQLVGTSSDTFYVVKDTTNKTIDVKAAGNCGTEGSPSIAYATLPSTLSSSAWIMRFKLVFNTVTGRTSYGSFFTSFFIVDNGTGSSGTGSENGFGFKFIADAGSTQTQFYSTTSGTDSGTTMSWTPSSSSTIYAEISWEGGTATANFYSDSGYSNRVSSTTANATRSGTFSGLKFPQIALLQNPVGGNGVMDIEMSDLKIQNGTSEWLE